MKVIIPGGNGFVGKRVCKLLKEKGIAYTSLSQRDGYDFRKMEDVERAFKEDDFDFVINCACFIGGIQFGLKYPGEIYYNNILMATNLMEASRKHGIKKFINPISNCSYPQKLKGKFKEAKWWDGDLHESVLVYGFARKASWVQSFAYKKQYDFDSINLILSNMYGPEDHFEEERSHALGALIMKFAEAKRNDNSNVVVWGTGNPIREWLYVDDGAEALVRALDVPPFVEPANVGVGSGVSIKELAEKIRDKVGYEGKIVFDTTKPDGAPYKIMDNTRLREIFNWAPSTSLDEGLDKTIKWYMENR